MSLSFLNPPVDIGDDKPVATRHADGTPPGLRPGYILEQGQGPASWFMGGLITMKARKLDTDGQFGFMEFFGPRGWCAPGHVHDGVAEVFYVLDGTLEVSVGDMVHSAMTAGSFLYVPSLTVHEWRITSESAKFLLLNTPGGFEEYFQRLGESAQANTFPYTETRRPHPDEWAAVRSDLGQIPTQGALKQGLADLPPIGRLDRAGYETRAAQLGGANDPGHDVSG